MEDVPPTLIFDGDCAFCTTAADWVARRWTGDAAPRAVPWQELPPQRAVALALTEADFARSVWWTEHARAEGGSRAVARALMATDGPWSVVGRLLVVPPISWLAAVGYRVVARYRHRLPGGSPACRA